MKIGLRIVSIVLSLVFILAGGAKLSGQAAMIESFTHFGMPIGFMYLIGASEVAGAIGLQIRKVAGYAAGGLLLIMFGAIGSHLLFDPIQKAVPAIILGALLFSMIMGIGKISRNEIAPPVL